MKNLSKPKILTNFKSTVETPKLNNFSKILKRAQEVCEKLKFVKTQKTENLSRNQNS